MSILDRIDKLEGLVTPEIGRVLYDLACEVPREYNIVEIGSYKGQSTCYLAAGAVAGNGARVHAVDPWELVDHRQWCRHCKPATIEQFWAQLESVKLDGQVTAHKMRSLEAAAQWRGSRIGLLYIDGDHAAEATLADFHAWRSYMTDGGTVVFDDLDTPGNPGVREAVDFIEPHLTGPVFIQAGRLGIGDVP